LRIRAPRERADPGGEETKNGSSKTLGDRIKIEVIVEDFEAEKTVNVILPHAQPESDELGGQITVLEVTEIQRIAPG
jgi:nitrogen regulatory protein PII